MQLIRYLSPNLFPFHHQHTNPHNTPHNTPQIYFDNTPIFTTEPATPDPSISTSQPHAPLVSALTQARHSTRTRTTPAHLQDFVCSALPISASLSYHPLSPSYCSFTLAISSDIEPSSFKQAQSDPRWQLAMSPELSALEATGTWIFVDPPPNISPIGSKWIFRLNGMPMVLLSAIMHVL